MTSGVFTIPLVSMDGSQLDSSEKKSIGPVDLRHYIAGPENKLLQVLFTATCGLPPQFNPITLCGPTGVGKSHLLHGLVERHRTWSNEARAVYLTGADFARGFARAIEIDSITEWRGKQRTANLLVIDDLQELSGKVAAQLELVHTIDAMVEHAMVEHAMVEHGRQLVFASRQAALDWHWMLPGLRSRLEGGLIIPVMPPAAPTQRRMLQEIASEHGLSTDGECSLPPLVDWQPGTLPHETILPGKIQPGKIQPGKAHAGKSQSGKTQDKTLSYPQIRQAVLQHVHSFTNPPQESEVAAPSSLKGSLPKIAKVVARQSHVKLSDLLGPSRRQTVVRARGIAFYLARTLLGLSFDEIGNYFGKRDHTTVLHSWRKTIERLETDVRLKHEVNKLTALLADNFEIQRH